MGRSRRPFPWGLAGRPLGALGMHAGTTGESITLPHLQLLCKETVLFQWFRLIIEGKSLGLKGLAAEH